MLKPKLENLEKERNKLLLQLEKREEKIKKLTRSYQETSHALKTAEQKVSAFRAQESTEKVTLVEKASSVNLNPSDLKKLFQRLEICRSLQDDLVTAYLPDGLTENLPQEVQDLVSEVKSNKSIVAFHCPMLFTLALVSPFPLENNRVNFGKSFDLDRLRLMLDTPVLIVAAHAGETLLGVALSNERFEERQIVKSTVKEKHTKGGWSQRRFERLRDEDIRQHADLVMERLVPLMKRYRPILSYAVVSGDPVLTKLVRPVLDLPVLDAKLGKFDQKRVDDILNEVYSFICYRR
ncbi:MAG: Vms1/Ankzf1 family peptidyl-tRNA hydrolase [Methanotrichaceae archaeon]